MLEIFFFNHKTWEDYKDAVQSYIKRFEGNNEIELANLELSKAKINPQFHTLIEFAEQFGHHCEEYNLYKVFRTDKAYLQELVAAVEKTKLFEWVSYYFPEEKEDFALSFLYQTYLNIKKHIKQMGLNQRVN